MPSFQTVGEIIMRMRKKKWADPYIAAHPEYILENPNEFKGKWKELYRTDELHVEIGTGKGDYLIQMSAKYPDTGWVGIEKDRSVAAVAAKKAIETANSNLTNHRMIVQDAENLENWFAPGEIDVIHLNFSDPWPKKHTHRRRLSSDRFLSMYRKLLSKNGVIRMKTDNKNLFEDSVKYFVQNGFQFSEFSVDFRRNEHPEDIITEYESRFMSLGQPIYQLCAFIPSCNEL